MPNSGGSFVCLFLIQCYKVIEGLGLGRGKLAISIQLCDEAEAHTSNWPFCGLMFCLSFITTNLLP